MKDNRAISSQSKNLLVIPSHAIEKWKALETRIEETKNKKYDVTGQKSSFYKELTSNKNALDYKIAAQETILEPQSKFLEIFAAITTMLANK